MKNLEIPKDDFFGDFRQVLAIETKRVLLSQLAKSPKMRAETNSWAMPNARRLPVRKTSQKSFKNPLKVYLNSFLKSNTFLMSDDVYVK